MSDRVIRVALANGLSRTIIVPEHAPGSGLGQDRRHELMLDAIERDDDAWLATEQDSFVRAAAIVEYRIES